ncbi:MAG: helix-turn-helix domain-containing protein [Candidatus Bathyarchaeia archaeon]
MPHVIWAEAKLPDYEYAVKSRNRWRVLEAIASKGGVANFKDIERASGVKGSTLTHHLDVLQSLNIVDREVKGTYRLKYKTPLCYLFGRESEVPFAYYGLLGRKDDICDPEPEVALKLLEKEGVTPKLVYVTTSHEALSDWKDLKLQYQWILCYEDQILDIDAVKRNVISWLESSLKEYVAILDCTSATKPATLAYYELAQMFYTPLIYVYEPTRTLKWLVSKETIKRRLGIPKGEE